MSWQWRRGVKVIAALGVFASLGVAAPACAELRTVGTFSAPVDVVAPAHEDHLLFVVERAGRIRVVKDGTVLPTPFLDISGSVGTTGEAGLLSLAFPPRYWQTGRFVVYYVDKAGVIQVAEYRRSAANPEVADPGSGRTILTIPHPTYTNHYGGSLAFGPDGLLYIGTGDGGGTGDPFGNAQNLDSLLGKVLRIDPFGGDPYAIPPGNPFVGQAGKRPEIFAYGLRNPWRVEFDRQTGDLVIGDVGQDEREEVDYIPAPLTPGLNFGWNAWEGTLRYSDTVAPNPVFPVLEYPHVDGGACSITGGVVVRDLGLTDLRGRYLYGDFCTGNVRSAVLGQPLATDDGDTGLDVPLIVSFGEDAGGCVYAVSILGTVSRIASPGAAAPVPCADVAPQTTITSATSSSGTATFTFTSSEAGSTFECGLDGGAWSTCASPAHYPVAPGLHSFAVRATDPGGTVDATPAQTFLFA